MAVWQQTESHIVYSSQLRAQLLAPHLTNLSGLDSQVAAKSFIVLLLVHLII